MKKFTQLKRLLGLAAFLCLFGGLFAQGTSTQTAKEELEAQSGANYDIWKATQFTQEVEPNKVLSSALNNQEKTYLIQLGWNLLNQDAANAYENKLQAQAGIIAVDADYQSNTVEITIKEEDEHDALRSLFDIE